MRTTATRLVPCSTGFSSGPSACIHAVSARPSQKNQRFHAVLSTFLPAVAMPSASSFPSAKPFSGSWQVAQLTRPSTESASSKNKRCPRSAARASSATALVGSAGASGIAERVPITSQSSSGGPGSAHDRMSRSTQSSQQST